MTAVEGALLIWVVVGAGVAAGTFLVARSAVQLADVGYRVLEKRLDPRVATRQTILLTTALLAAGAATALIAGYALLVLLGVLLEGAQ